MRLNVSLKRQGQLSSCPSVYVLDLTDIRRAISRIFRFVFQPLKSTSNSPRTRAFRQKASQIGRSSDNRRFRSPNYSAWRRSRTESLLSNARYSINSPPCARFARALGAPRTALFTTPPLGAGAVGTMSSWCPLRLQ